MARIARVVAPGFPHYITQRGNRQQPTFFEDSDYKLYIALMAEWCDNCDVEIWAYCLMPNHVHLIAVPSSREALAKAIGQAHVRYSRHVNSRMGWRGYLWQGRFASFVMDEERLLAAARHIERNPVNAGICKDPWGYAWSSARAHVRGRDNKLVHVRPLLDMVDSWRRFLRADSDDGDSAALLRKHERTGRPLGDQRFLARIEKLVGRVLRKKKPGPKPKKKKPAR